MQFCPLRSEVDAYKAASRRAIVVSRIDANIGFTELSAGEDTTTADG